jgi:hypothetical protein
VEECTYFWGVNTSWGINTDESKGPLNQEDNQAPQPTLELSLLYTVGLYIKLLFIPCIFSFDILKIQKNRHFALLGIFVF